MRAAAASRPQPQGTEVLDHLLEQLFTVRVHMNSEQWSAMFRNDDSDVPGEGLDDGG